MSSFSDLALLPSLVTSLTEQGLTRPTDIQARTVPALLGGGPVIGVSETGSGKTLAYVLPMLHQLKTLEVEGDAVTQAGRPRGLVLSPGRELAEQVSRVFKGLTHGTRLRVRMVSGGSPKQMARQNVGGPFEILVATPGRLVQLVEGGSLRLDDVRMVVLDEADRLLDPSFVPVIDRILGGCPRRVQLAMFSATLPETLDAVVQDRFAEAPLQIRTHGSHRVVSTLTTDHRPVADGRRFDMLQTLFEEDAATGTLLFTNTREQCDTVEDWLDAEGIPFVTCRGEMDRKVRRANLARFRDGEVSVLLATDLGGRGLDIDRVERVVNVYLPKDIDAYLHRVGRTARAGRRGLVVNLVTPRDQSLMTKIGKREARRH